MYGVWNMEVGMKAKLSFAALALAVASFAGQGGWAVPKSVKITFSEKGITQSDRTYTVSRLGKHARVDGAFAVYGAFGRTAHSEILNDGGSYLYVPQLKAALRQFAPAGADRIEASQPTSVRKTVFDLPKTLFEKEMKVPARFDGEEKVAGRDCYVLTTADPASSMRQEKQWIDKVYGIVLKYQRIEANKPTFTREATVALFDGSVTEEAFKLPADTQVTVAGVVSPNAFEKLRELGDQAKYEAELRDMADKQAKRNPGMFPVSRLTPPEGLGYATTSFRPGTKPMPLRNPNGDSAGKNNAQVITLPSGGQVREIRAVLSTVDGEPGEHTIQLSVPQPIPGGVSEIAVKGDFIVFTSDDALTPAELEEVSRAKDKDAAMKRIMARKNAAKATDGMFVSEFIDSSTGRSLVFYQSKDVDPSQSLLTKAQLAEFEKVNLNGQNGSFHHTTAPFERSVFVWMVGNMRYAISASGFSKEEIGKIAASVQPLPAK